MAYVSMMCIYHWFQSFEIPIRRLNSVNKSDETNDDTGIILCTFCNMRSCDHHDHTYKYMITCIDQHSQKQHLRSTGTYLQGVYMY